MNLQQSLNSLIGQPLDNVSSSINDILTFITIGSGVLLTLVLLFWVTNYIHRRQMQRAIMEIRDLVKEMNERDKRPDTSARLATTTTEVPAQDQ